MHKKSILKEANDKFRSGDYKKALDLYYKITNGNSLWNEMLAANIDLCKKKLDSQTILNIHKRNKIIKNNSIKSIQNLSNDENIKKNEVQAAKDFGEILLGPILAKYIYELVNYIRKSKSVKKLYFISRDGYLLKKYFDKIKKSCGVGNVESEYLLCSRVFLFKLLLILPDAIKFTLEHPFNGSYLSMLRDRFCLSNIEIKKIYSLSPRFRDIYLKNVSLPIDAPFVHNVLEEIGVILNEEISYKLKVFLSYLDSIGFGECDIEHISDLGYSGTIQKALNCITNVSTCGHYFYTTPKAKNNCKIEFIGHLLDQVPFGNCNPLLDKSLFIESILTSPDGQVVDINVDSFGNYLFKYDNRSKNINNFYDIENVFSGAEHYATNSLITNCIFEIPELQQFYDNVICNDELIPPGLRHLFHVDDFISGAGLINAVALFKEELK